MFKRRLSCFRSVFIYAWSPNLFPVYDGNRCAESQDLLEGALVFAIDCAMGQKDNAYGGNISGSFNVIVAIVSMDKRKRVGKAEGNRS
jgi:hypothetical protein